jgi:hypothetical protein
MIDLLKLIIGALASLFRPRAKLEAENLVPAATDQCALLADAEATRYEQYRSFSVRLALSLVSSASWERLRLLDRRKSFNGITPGSYVLALLISQPRWQTEGLGSVA